LPKAIVPKSLEERRRRNFFSVKAFQAEWKERLFGEL
jgi:hypothetical protein